MAEKTGNSLVWFRSDLRTYDNPALSGACAQEGRTLAVFFICESQWQNHGLAPAKYSLMLRQLLRLKRDLNDLNIPLLVIDADNFDAVPAALSELARQLDISSLHFSQELPVDERKRDREVASLFKQNGLEIRAYHDQCIVKPGSVVTKQGECFKVFTAYKAAWFRQLNMVGYQLIPKPTKQCAWTGAKLADCFQTVDLEGKLADLSNRWKRLWPEGEEEAHMRLHRFLESKVKHYKDQRDIPLLPGTSLVSPYLALGIISPKQCFHGAVSVNHGNLQEGSPGVQTWINELIWREFYRHFMRGFPYVSKSKPFISWTSNVPWQQDERLFEAWTLGKTGYPIVDAAMRQLNRTGWMHNRLRMISAMFLSKHLLIDWRLGEQYFMSQLVDGDFASNNGGWQWSASTGADAVPYFRVFNPFRQAERFDPDARFIRKYVKELRGIEAREIHDSQRSIKIGDSYAAPVVEHGAAVERVKREFKLAKEAYQPKMNELES